MWCSFGAFFFCCCWSCIVRLDASAAYNVQNSPLQHASLTSHRIWNARILCMSVWDTFYNAFKNYECVISQLDTKTVENHIFFPLSLAIFFPFHLHFLLSFIIGKYLDKKIEMKKKKMWRKKTSQATPFAANILSSFTDYSVRIDLMKPMIR